MNIIITLLEVALFYKGLLVLLVPIYNIVEFLYAIRIDNKPMSLI